MTKPHVLIISPSLSKGGMERQLSIFLNHYDRSQLQVTVALLKANIAYEIPHDIKIINLHRKFARNPLFYWRLWKELNKSKYQLINSKISGVNELVLLFCGILNKSNVIVEVRNTKDRLLSNYRRMHLLFKTFGKDWWVICNSKLAQQEVKETLPPKSNVWFVGNGIDTDYFINHPRTSRGEFTIVFVGRITPQKNIELLIRSLPLISQSIGSGRLLIQGAIIDSQYYQFLQSEINSLAVGSRITWIAPHERNVRDTYNEANVFVLPSLYEGTPNVLLEAMSCECVCLSSHSANTDQFLSNEFAFDNDSPQQLAEKIDRIAQLSATERQVIGRQNRTYVINSYSVPKMVNTLTDIITKKVAPH